MSLFGLPFGSSGCLQGGRTESHVLFLVQGQGYNLYSKEGIDMVRNVLFAVSLVLFFSPLSSQVRGDTTLTSITRFPHQDSTRSISEAFPLVLADHSILLFWADSTGIRYSKSVDGGLTWNSSVPIATPARFAAELTGIRTFSGRFLVFWRDSLGIRLTQSDDGMIWSVPVSLGTAQAGMHVSQTLNGKIWLSFRQSSGGRFVTSTDNGVTWSTVQTLPTPLAYDGCFADGEAGRIHFFYSQSAGSTFPYTIYRITSMDNGSTWSSPDTITKNGRRPRLVREPGDTLLLVFENWQSDSIPLRYNTLDINYSESTDNGLSWSSPEQITRFVGNDMSHNVAMLNGKPFFTFASERGRSGSRQIWYGIVGETPDDNPPPILISGSTYHVLNGLENWIQAYVDDETGIASVTARISVDGVGRPPVQLYDDGTHFDVKPGDNIWGSSIQPLSVGSVECQLSIADVTGNTLNVTAFRSTVSEPPPSNHVTQGNAMKTAFDGRGAFGKAAYPNNYPGFGIRYPADSYIEHLYGAGIWVGGKIDTTTGGTGPPIKRVSTAYEGSFGPLFEFFPNSTPADTIWRVFGRNAPKPAGWDAYWGNSLPFRPVADQNFFNRYNDYTQPVTSHVPMGVKVIQSSYTWDDATTEGIQILEFRIVNNAMWTIDSAYIGFFMDADVGTVDTTNTYLYNRAGSLAFTTAYTENPVRFGSTPVGVTVLNTYKPLDSLRLTFVWYHGTEGPVNDGARFALMSMDTVFANQVPLFDTRFLLSFGPFTIRPYTSLNPDTLDVAFAILAAMDLNQLKSRAVTARNIYQTITGVKLSDDFVPREFALEQNFPNPFNPITTIRFHIAQPSHAVVEVFDLLGRHVATLVNEELAAGSYETTLNASQLSSGVYIYRLKAGSYVSTKKALLLK